MPKKRTPPPSKSQKTSRQKGGGPRHLSKKSPTKKPPSRPPAKTSASSLVPRLEAPVPPPLPPLPPPSVVPQLVLSVSFVRDGDEFLARLESYGGHITELKNRSLDQLLTLVAGELEDLLT